MPRKSVSSALANLVREAERTCTDLRAVAADVTELADAIERSQPGRSAALMMNARRLTAIADSLILEAQAASADTARRGLRIALVLLAASAPLAVGLAEGAGSQLVNAIVASTAKATSSVTSCTDAANALASQQQEDRSSGPAGVLHMRLTDAFATLDDFEQNGWLSTLGEVPPVDSPILRTYALELSRFLDETAPVMDGDATTGAEIRMLVNIVGMTEMSMRRAKKKMGGRRSTR